MFLFRRLRRGALFGATVVGTAVLGLAIAGPASATVASPANNTIIGSGGNTAIRDDLGTGEPLQRVRGVPPGRTERYDSAAQLQLPVGWIAARRQPAFRLRRAFGR